MYALREFQADLINRVYTAWQTHRRVMMQSATGSGKTVMFSRIIADMHAQRMPVLMVVHRRELVQQAADKLFRMGIPYGVIQAGYTPSPAQYVQLASVQTATRRALPEDRFQCIIIDEAHHAVASSYTSILAQYPNAYVLGVTATPCRTNGQGFDDLFDVLVAGPQIPELIRQGHLVQPIHKAAPLRLDRKSLAKQRGEFTDQAQMQALSDGQIVGGFVDQWRKHAEGMRTIGFAVNVEHSKQIVESYRAAGIPAAHIDGTTPDDERKRILRDFERGAFTYLSNVGIATEGYDVPGIEAVQVCRMTASVALWLQMGGRALRPAPGKESAIIMDHGNNVFELGRIDAEREWTLDGHKAKPKQMVLIDRATGRTYEPRDLPEHVTDVDLVEVDFDPRRIGQLTKLLASADRRGYKPGWAWYKFVERVGTPERIEIELFAARAGYKSGWVSHKLVEHGHINPWPGYSGPLPPRTEAA